VHTAALGPFLITWLKRLNGTRQALPRLAVLEKVGSTPKKPWSS
jgi:hypothetical protein